LKRGSSWRGRRRRPQAREPAWPLRVVYVLVLGCCLFWLCGCCVAVPQKATVSHRGRATKGHRHPGCVTNQTAPARRCGLGTSGRVVQHGLSSNGVCGQVARTVWRGASGDLTRNKYNSELGDVMCVDGPVASTSAKSAHHQKRPSGKKPSSSSEEPPWSSA
jgi:hypothetical protein